MAADLTGNPKSPTGLPKPLFKPKGLPAAVADWDISPDGKKFLFPIPVAASTTAPPFTVVLNWTSGTAQHGRGAVESLDAEV